MSAEAIVASRLLRAARTLDWLSITLLVIALWKGLIVASAIGLLARWFGFRVAFDAWVFDDVAAGRLSLEEFDRAAVALRLMPEEKAGRAIADRCRGAKRLAAILSALTLLQAIAMIIGSP